SDIGLVGLGVMGASLALNMESKGFKLSVFNYIPEVTDKFMAGPGKGKGFTAAHSYEELVASLSAPRKVFLMVTAGSAVDAVIERLVPLLDQGDVIIDGGNSHFPDTERRTAYLESKGLLFVGTGVSGGEEGALKGPSMMPGGSPAAWPLVKPLFQSISAKVSGGIPCCDWVGRGGAGHFVKMVHNGIEYGDIQLICECYQFMRDGLGMDNARMQEIFAGWNTGELESYLIEITADILGRKDAEGRYVLDTILDTAGQKGTGKWTAVAALDAGVAVPLIVEAVFARCLSAVKEERVAASASLDGPKCFHSGRSEAEWTELLGSALYAAKIISYAQGFALMKAAAREQGWPLDYGRIAQLWRGGCIIRSVFLDKIKEAFDRKPDLDNLMLDSFFREKLSHAQRGLREVVAAAAMAGIPAPALSSALSYYDGYRCSRLGANLLQAQRDYFGAHTYERVDRPRGEFHHFDWK
ncbi:MAG: decarboxylating NADP(+)-dependent phosphogluconate dehydrogenase, partial [Bacteroidales bacterium]|nr:decarboxylating NADP(+)-dependent phosphogluconate dehydrogenase [Bacteroidales bacterium]